MQRIGRVDRIGSPHDVVRTYNFVPDEGLEDRLLLIRRLRSKIHAIELALGVERPVLADVALNDRVPVSIAADKNCDDRVREWMRARTRIRRKRQSSRAPAIALELPRPNPLGGDSQIPVAWIDAFPELPDIPGDHGAALAAEPLVLFAVYASGRAVCAVALFPTQHIIAELDPAAVAALCIAVETAPAAKPGDLEERLIELIPQLRPPIALGRGWRRPGERKGPSAVAPAQKVMARAALSPMALSPAADHGPFASPTADRLAKAERLLLRLSTRRLAGTGSSTRPEPAESRILALVAVGNGG